MNNKRQTVWLVSMLCLMVVLSAYYLFTEDTGGSEQVATEGTSAEPSPAAETDAGQGGAQAAEAAQSKALQSGQEKIARLELQQMTDLGRKMDELTKIAADSRRPKEETAKAAEQLQRLEEEYEKITHIQEKLESEYKFPNAVLLKENDRWNVYVDTDKLEKSEAASIATLVMQELGVRADQISIRIVR